VKRTRQERIRLGILFVAIVAFFLLAILRLGQFQVVWASSFSQIVDRQSSGKIAIPAERGMIYDRHGRSVAKNIIRSSLYAHPETRDEMNRAAAYLEKLFDLRAGTAVNKLGMEVGRFRWIKRHLPDRTADRIAREAPSGLYLREEATREYPLGPIGQQVLGFTNIDNEGLSGFELAYDSLLAGKNGWADIRRDGLRNTYRVKESALVKPVPGQPVVLTIDWQLQETVEEELRCAVEEYSARTGMAAFVDCNNGDILAMAHYDPEEKDPLRPVKLRAVTDQFEPGSVFKPFTAAGLLDAGLVDFSDSTYCEMGRWRVGRRILHDDKELGWLNFRQVIELSSNIGLGKHAVQMGGPALTEVLRGFGIGQKPGCGLPGETSGRMFQPATWSDYNIAALAMGHSVAVSALQMVMGFSAIANDGELLRPHLLLGYVDDNGYVEQVNGREVVGRAMQKAFADSLRAFLRGVVENGTGQPVNSPFVSIAGKTGTAEIPNLDQGGYYKSRFTASFCGFFPAETPLIAGIVVLENPHPVHYGGHTSGKAFRRVAEQYTVSNPDLFAVTNRTYVEHTRRLDITLKAPDLAGRNVTQARVIADNRGVKLRCSAAEGTVVWQFPPPDRLMFAADEMLLGVAPPGEERPCMIDLSGLSIRKASAFLNHSGIKFTVKGTGRIHRQSIRPGEMISEGATCLLECRSIGQGRKLSS
jgi:cell division protein FtsI (penicillin-binding protein 3)